MPMDEERRRKWIEAIENHQEFNDLKQFFVCELHFTNESLLRCGSRVFVKQGAVPSIFPSFEVKYLNENTHNSSV